MSIYSLQKSSFLKTFFLSLMPRMKSVFNLLLEWMSETESEDIPIDLEIKVEGKMANCRELCPFGHQLICFYLIEHSVHINN